LTASQSGEARRLVEAVKQSHASGQGLAISGSGSKSFLMPTQQDSPVSMLSVAELTGVLDYEPDSLVLTARAGTPLRELRAIVAREQQMLPFDPPMFSGGGTLGGAIASGLSGPGRPWWGSVRDCVLGIELVNGLGEQLTFGGKVMKNVAGYDLSRLQVGGFGTLGVILTASIRLLPQPSAERTCVLKLSAAESLARVRDFARRPLPLSGTCFDAGQLRVRLSGAEAAVLSACAQIGGEIVERDHYWQQLRDHELPTFRTDAEVWRWSLPPGAAAPSGNALIEWAGALRWVTGPDADDVTLAEHLGGTAAPFSAGYAQLTAGNMPAALSRYHQRLKAAFDPKNILNPGLVSADAC
jgi:glycolate oxidase FAD binding subunit